MDVKLYQTDKLDIAYVDLGANDAPVLFLIHGWPDDASAWYKLAPMVFNQGYRLIIPYLRGCGPTVFNNEKWPRDGSSAALVQDVIDLADGLLITSFFLAGHDWGARVAYQIATLFPKRVKAIAAIALAYQPRGEFKMPSFKQAKNFWYQWLMMVDAGAAQVASDPVGFAQIQWDTWSPDGWYDEIEFQTASLSFQNPDWVSITLNGYRRRFIWAITDPDYKELSRKVAGSTNIEVPTLMIQGGADTCDPPQESEGLEGYFNAGYQRVVLDGIGHFPMREAPFEVAAQLLIHFNGLRNSR